MRLKLTCAALLAAALLLAQCGGGDHSSPSDPGTMMGTLRFVDSGCTCSPPPRPPVTVYVDGQKYSFPLFGSIDIPLTAGSHRWALAAGLNPTVVQIVAGATITEHLFDNIGCPDGCDTGGSAAP
jgi:hypothetical protein